MEIQTAIYVMLALMLYFAPAWLAAPGKRLTVFVVVLCFGFTLIGWGIALVMATRSWEKRRA